jgi:hypothetical protein
MQLARAQPVITRVVSKPDFVLQYGGSCRTAPLAADEYQQCTHEQPPQQQQHAHLRLQLSQPPVQGPSCGSVPGLK